MVLVLAFAALMFLSCSETHNDNPNDPNGTNYIGIDNSSSSSDVASSSGSIEESSSSSEETLSSSSGEDLSSSSGEESGLSSSGEEDGSSSSMEDSGSSSSAGELSSSSEADSSSSSSVVDLSSSSSVEENNLNSSSSNTDISSSSETLVSSSSETPSSSSEAKCNGAPYDSGTHGCCNGIIFDKTNQQCNSDRRIETNCGGDWIVFGGQTQFRCNNGIVETQCGTEYYNASDDNFRCEENVVERKCGNAYYNPSEKFCNTNKIYDMCDETDYNPADVFCYDNKKVNRCGNREEEFDPSKYWCEDNKKIYLRNVGDPDTRYYYAVLIGTQTWMTKNISTDCSSSSSSDCACAYTNEDECKVAGYLYSWYKAMNLSEGQDVENYPHKGICPVGYHIPTTDEWDTLFRFVDKSTDCRDDGQCNIGALLSIEQGNWQVDCIEGICSTYAGTDLYGFNALTSGLLVTSFIGGTFSIAERPFHYSYYWTTEKGTPSSWFSFYRAITSGGWSGGNIYGETYFDFFMMGVRCLKDAEED